MPRIIETGETAETDLQSCVAALLDKGFDPQDEESLDHAARQLKQLANNRNFLGDIVIEELKNRCRDQSSRNNYSAQVIMLFQDGGDFFLRANLWPSADDALVRASGMAPFYFDVPHDHNFSFLTVGYSGPGYWSDYYEFDYESVEGIVGEQVDLTFVEHSRLDLGKLMLYRAHKDIHRQLPADALSVSVNIMHMAQHQPWYDQYRFDLESGRIDGILTHTSGESLLKLAVHVAGGNGLDVAEQFARSHPSARVRFSAIEALASACPDADSRRRIWHGAAADDLAFVRAGAAKRLALLEGS